MPDEFIPRPKDRLPDGGRMSTTKPADVPVTPLKPREAAPDRPKPERQPEPDGFTAEQLSAQREAQELQDLLRYLADEQVRQFEESLKG